jgi:hypothetical protein
LILTGQALLAGNLSVALLNGFSPALGNTFAFLSAAGGVSGAFDTLSLPALSAGLSWSINYNSTNVQLSVVEALAGDFNSDGSVDAADYVAWRKTNGTQAGYNVWRANFGQTAGRGSLLPGSSSFHDAVPEPCGALLLIFATALSSARRRGRALPRINS